jgi:error-prone DNA polymerase
MTAGSEVVEDHAHVGLTLRSHPVSSLRGDLNRQRIFTCIATTLSGTLSG